jgi:hypothetical protein
VNGGRRAPGPARRARPRRKARGEVGTSLLEVLVVAQLATLVLACALTLARTHVAVARGLQATLSARAAAEWALGVAVRDIALAGADPTRAGITAVSAATATSLVLEADRDGDGAIDTSSAERVQLAQLARPPGSPVRLVRSLGGQAMPIASNLAPDGFRLRYFDADGAEIAGSGVELDEAERERIRRVTLEIAVREDAGRSSAEVRLRTSAALRSRLGEGR